MKTMRTLLTTLAVVSLAPGWVSAADDSLFRQQFAPILERHCIRCHGEEETKGGLSLISRKTTFEGGNHGTVLVPGRPDESRLYQMVTGDKPKMPKNAAPLTAEQRAALKGWIEKGAAWPDGLTLQDRRFEGITWWSLQPPVRPPLPAVRNAAWLRTPIDAFILAPLEAKGLSPSPEADRVTLIRRLTYDLHGLSPTPEEIDAFVNDANPDAYERLIDRLLASPRYGERWGRHWLDVVHYGDTHGYDKDKRRDHAWPYRDYVIRSFNADKPYSRFICEQLAGDVLWPNDSDGVIATGFIVAGPWDFVGHVELREGTVDKLKTRLLDRDDMVANAMSTFTSMTVHCARCHDHKFDPIMQKDYYRLQAVFAGVERDDRPIEDPAFSKRRKELLDQHMRWVAQRFALSFKVKKLTSPELTELAGELKNLQEALAALQPAREPAPSPTNGYHSAIMAKPEAEKWVQVDLGKSLPIDAIRLIPARPTDFPDTPGFGFPVRFRIDVSDDPTFAKRQAVADHTAADFANPKDTPFTIRLTDRSARYVRVTATRLWPRTNDYVFALAELQVESGGKNVARGAAVTALDSIEAGRWSTKHLVDGFDSRKKLADDTDPAAAARLRKRGELTKQIDDLEARHAQIVEGLIPPETKQERARLAVELAAIDRQLQALPKPPEVYAAKPIAPRPIHLLRRGDVEQPGPLLGPGALAAVQGLESDFKLADPEAEGRRRVALAEWITDRRNPLTRRSIVNRIWHYHFGRGIVDTPNDFGRMGGMPSHPELLDWLAVEFLERGESIKELHRLILRSATYRQTSAENPAHAKVDGDNRLLWKKNRQRLDAESVRDAVLGVSGALDFRAGGPGFEVFRFKDDHSPIYDHSALEKINDPASWRRTVYRFTVRSVPNPFLECLDCADPNINTPVRNSTLTALQALALLNDPFMVKQSELFAARLTRISADPGAQIDAAYRLAFGRRPTTTERDTLVEFAGKHGLANACRVLFNANEFVFVD